MGSRMRQRSVRVGAWWIAAFATIGVSLLFPINIPIIDLELASTAQAASALVARWSAGGAIADAQRSVLIDYLFIPLYVATLAFGCIWASRVYVTSTIRTFGRAIAPLVVLAGILDAIENVGLLRMLATDPAQIGQTWPAWTAAFAYVKFFIVATAMLYLIGGAFTRAWQWVRSRPHNGPPDWVDLMRTSDLRESKHWSADAAPPWMAEEWKPTPQRIGVSCSGGGIRSAAYNLGALQALQSAGKLQRARYITAVSGGSYMAGAWAILNQESERPLDPPAFATTSPEEDYLRNHSSYIAPNIRGLLWGLCRFLLGATANFLFLFLLILSIARPLGWALSSRYVHPEIASTQVGAAIHVSGSMWLAIIVSFAIAVGAAFMSVLVRWSTRIENLFLRPAKLALALAAALFVSLVVFPWTVRTVPSFLASPATYLPILRVTGGQADPRESFGIAGLIQALGLGATIIAGLRAFLSKNKATVVTTIARAIPWLVIGLGVVMVAYSGAVSDKSLMVSLAAGIEIPRQLALWIVALAGLVLFYFVADQTTWSLHPFYKRRLASAFALWRHAPDADGERVSEIDYDTELKLTNFPQPSVSGPQLVVCAAANLSDEGLTPVGRRCVSYTFSSTEVGGPGVGWVKPETLETTLCEVRGREDVTLMAAMAISGAAVSSAMGKLKQSRLGSLLAFVNARLGVWLPNLRWIGEFGDRGMRWRDRPHATYMLKELVRSYRSDERFVYVSDGGHWENLGLVELLRRGCTEIYCFDASGDKVDTFTTVGQAIAIARTEVEVEILIDLSQRDEATPDDTAQRHMSRRQRKKVEELKRDPRLANHDHWTGILRYADGTLGRIVVVKLAVTKDTPFDVKAYAAADPQFPTHSTVDQLFNHEKFEAYRALGEASCWNALHAMQQPFGIFAIP